MSSDFLRDLLRGAFQWRQDPDQDHGYADDSGWFRDPFILTALGPALMALLPSGSPQPTVIIGTESRGSMLAALTAAHMGVGIAEVRKKAERGSHDDEWLTQLTPPDYRDRHLTLAIRRPAVTAGAQVLFVNDWIDTGAQALACQQLVIKAGGHRLGAHVIVDSLTDSRMRRELAVRSLLNHRQL